MSAFRRTCPRTPPAPGQHLDLALTLVENLGSAYEGATRHLVLAKSQGCATWHELIQRVGTIRVEVREMYRWFGVEFNNEAWELIDDGLDSPLPHPGRRRGE